MAKEYTHRNLIVWQRAQELAVAVVKLVQQLPQNWANAVLARQIIASATSIGANIAEGHGRYTIATYRNHLSIARGSTAETDSWLDLLRRTGYISPDEEQALQHACSEIMALLTHKMIVLNRAERDHKAGVREASEVYQVSGVSDVDEPPFPFVPGDYVE